MSTMAELEQAKSIKSKSGSEPLAEGGNGAGAPREAAVPAQQRGQVAVTDRDAISLYANFCRVTGTPEELILDFGLNAQPFGVPTDPVEVKQRIVVNYFTAKRMLQALHMSVQRHEQAFGVLETDVQKRVLGSARTPVRNAPADPS